MSLKRWFGKLTTIMNSVDEKAKAFTIKLLQFADENFKFLQ